MNKNNLMEHLNTLAMMQEHHNITITFTIQQVMELVLKLDDQQTNGIDVTSDKFENHLRDAIDYLDCSEIFERDSASFDLNGSEIILTEVCYDADYIHNIIHEHLMEVYSNDNE